MTKLQYKFYALTFPTDFTLEQTLDYLDSVAVSLKRPRLLGESETMILELWSDKTGLTHRLGLPWERSELISQLRHHIPGTHIEEHSREYIPDWTEVVEVGVSDGTRPFNLVRVHAQVRRILAAVVADMKADDTLLIQWVISPADRVKPPTTAKPPVSSHWAVSALLKGNRADNDEIAERRENLAQNQFRAVLRVAAHSSTVPHAKKLIQNVRKAYKAPETPSVHFTEMWWTKPANRKKRLNTGAGIKAPIHFINATELAAFSGWPIGVNSFPGLHVGRTRDLPPSELMPREGLILGEASASGYEGRPLALNEFDLFRSMWILGPPGSGKTTLSENILRQVVNKGWSANMIETKGDLFYRGLNAIAPEHVDNTIAIDLSDKNFSVGLNLLHDGDARSTVAGLVDLFAKGTTDPKLFNQAATNGWHTLRLIPGTTVIDLVPLLDPSTDDEKAWQEWVVSQIPKNHPLQSFWRPFLQRKEVDRRNRVAPVVNRLWKFDSHETLRRFLGQGESTFSLRDAIIEGKNIMLYAPYTIGKDEVSLLVSLMVDQMWQIIQQTKGLKKKPTFIFMDEIQRLAQMPIDLAEMVTVMRSYESAIIGGHQYMGQLNSDLLQAMTATGTKVTFRLDGPDARAWQSIAGKSITPDDIMNLEAYKAIGRIANSGGVSEPVGILTLPSTQPYGQANRILADSRRKYARPASEVEAEILKRRSAPAKPMKQRPKFEDVEVNE